MDILLYFIGLLILSIAAAGLVKPYLMDALIDRHGIAKAYWLAISARVIFAVIFLLGAESTRVPQFFIVMGWLLLAVAAALWLLGIKRFEKATVWWESVSAAGQRIWFGALGIVGLLILFLV